TSNAGGGAVVIARTIPKMANLGTDGSSFSLGTTDSTGAFFVANFGDDGTSIQYEVISDRDWLFVSPSSGSSQGTALPPPFKDFRQHNFFVDRSRMGGSSGVGTLTIRATAVNTDQDPAEIPEVTVRIVVEAA